MATKTDLTSKNPAELLALLAEKRAEMRDLRFSAAGARVKDAHAARKQRADIARIMTELGARKRAA